MKRFVMVLMAASCATAAFAAEEQGQLLDGIEAIVHDSLITLFEVESTTRPAIEALARQMREQGALQRTNAQEVLEKKYFQARHENIDTLVEHQLILQEFKSFNVPESIVDSEVDREIEAEIKSRFGDRMTLINTLHEEGLTMEKHRRQIRDHMIISWLTQKNVQSELLISPHKVEAYYLAHREEEGLKVEDQVKLRMIVLTQSDAVPEPKKLGEELVGKLKDGASFTELAGIYSQGSSRKEGGLWGWATRKQLRKELADVAFSLKPGAYSDVVEIHEPDKPDSCYIMLVEEKQEGHYRPLAEVRDEIERELKLEERSRLREQWIAKLKKKTFVQYR